MPDNNSTNDEELDFAAEIIQNAGFLYLEKKRLSNESEKKLTQLKIKIHDIIFENRDNIKECLYLELMNIIKD